MTVSIGNHCMFIGASLRVTHKKLPVQKSLKGIKLSKHRAGFSVQKKFPWKILSVITLWAALMEEVDHGYVEWETQEALTNMKRNQGWHLLGRNGQGRALPSSSVHGYGCFGVLMHWSLSLHLPLGSKSFWQGDLGSTHWSFLLRQRWTRGEDIHGPRHRGKTWPLGKWSLYFRFVNLACFFSFQNIGTDLESSFEF